MINSSNELSTSAMTITIMEKIYQMPFILGVAKFSATKSKAPNSPRELF